MSKVYNIYSTECYETCGFLHQVYHEDEDTGYGYVVFESPDYRDCLYYIQGNSNETVTEDEDESEQSRCEIQQIQQEFGTPRQD